MLMLSSAKSHCISASFQDLAGDVGFLSGVFGGGSLMTSRVTTFVVPPAVALATKANQLLLNRCLECYHTSGVAITVVPVCLTDEQLEALL